MNFVNEMYFALTISRILSSPVGVLRMTELKVIPMILQWKQTWVKNKAALKSDSKFRSAMNSFNSWRSINKSRKISQRLNMRKLTQFSFHLDSWVGLKYISVYDFHAAGANIAKGEWIRLSNFKKHKKRTR